MVEIIKEYQSGDCVTNLKGHVSDENEVTLTWDWPENESYDLCVVFGLEREGESLTTLLERKAKKTIYANEFGVCHRENVLTSYAQFKVFPARRENGTLYIVDQKLRNLSEAFRKKACVGYRVEYDRPKLMSSFRKARILVQGLDQLEEGYICYRCCGGGKDSILYGIDLASFGGQGRFEVVVGRNESIELYLEESQKNYLELVRC
jgi:hypothetical protein